MSSLTVQVRWWCCVVVVVVSYNEQRTDNEREGCFSRKGFPIFLEIQFLDFICWISGGILFLECQKYHCAQNRAVIFLEKIHIYIFFSAFLDRPFPQPPPKHTVQAHSLHIHSLPSSTCTKPVSYQTAKDKNDFRRTTPHHCSKKEGASDYKTNPPSLRLTGLPPPARNHRLNPRMSHW